MALAGSAGLDGFVLFPARLPQVDVHVDQARRDDLAGGVENPLAAGRQRIVRGDPAAFHEQAANAVQRLAGIDQPAVLNEDALRAGPCRPGCVDDFGNTLVSKRCVPREKRSRNSSQRRRVLQAGPPSARAVMLENPIQAFFPPTPP